MTVQRCSQPWFFSNLCESGIAPLLALVMIGMSIVAPAAAQDTTLVGTVRMQDGTPLVGVQVTLVGIGTQVTTSSGEFDIRVPARRIGQSAEIQALKSGWHVIKPMDASIIIPADSTQRPVHIIMVPNSANASKKLDARGNIYISRIINPPRGESRQTSTVWLGAEGPSVYIVDSIEITHFKGPCLSLGTGAVPPVATYQFSFEYGSDSTYALNPALALNPVDQREVSFTLGLAPSGTFSSSCGHVFITLGYHTLSGILGHLPLHEPPKEASYLSRILNVDVIEDGLVVTPRGLLRGMDQGEEELLEYERIQIPYKFSAYYTSDLASDAKGPEPSMGLSRERKLLNARIASSRLWTQIGTRLKDGDDLAFDLCAGSGEMVCDTELHKMLADQRLGARALRALAIRHILQPSPDFAESVIAFTNSHTLIEDPYFLTEETASALANHPVGKWLEALLSLAAKDQRYSHALVAIERSHVVLGLDDREAVRRTCDDLLATALPPREAVLYLLSVGVPVPAITAALEKTPPGLSASAKDEAVYYRQSLKDDVLREAAKQSDKEK